MKKTSGLYSQDAYSEDQRELLTTLVRQYRQPDGKIAWKQAWEEHPEWKKVFKHLPMQVLYVRAYDIKKKLAKEEPPAAPPASDASPLETAPRGGLQSEKELIEQVVTEYSSAGFVNWSFAFAEHPEWKKALAHLNKSSLYSRGNAYKRKLFKQRKQEAPPRAPRKLSLNGLATAPVGEAKSLCFCPRCGENLAMWQKVVEVMKGL